MSSRIAPYLITGPLEACVGRFWPFKNPIRIDDSNKKWPAELNIAKIYFYPPQSGYNWPLSRSSGTKNNAIKAIQWRQGISWYEILFWPHFRTEMTLGAGENRRTHCGVKVIPFLLEIRLLSEPKLWQIFAAPISGFSNESNKLLVVSPTRH